MSLPSYITRESIALAMDPEPFNWKPTGGVMDMKMKLRAKHVLQHADRILDVLRRIPEESKS